MKKRFILAIFITLISLAVLTSCNSYMSGENVKVIPISKKNEDVSVLEIGNLFFNGTILDVNKDKSKILIKWENVDEQGNEIKGLLWDIGEADMVSRSIKKLGSMELLNSAQYLPDEKALQLFKTGEGVSEPWIMENTPGSKLEKSLIDAGGGGIIAPYVWSADNRYYAVSLSYEDGYEARLSIYDNNDKLVKRIEVNNGEDNGIYNLFYNGVTPCFYNNDTILFATTRGVKALKFLEGTSQSEFILDSHNFSLSGDGRYIACAVPETEGGFRIKVYSILDKNFSLKNKIDKFIKQQTNLMYPVRIVWSDDCRYVAFTDKSTIWVMDIESGENKQVFANMTGFVDNIKWLSGKKFIFNSWKDTGDNYRVHAFSLELN